ncbi:MAG: PIN domain-containing protein [Oscillospiraceae bacterium]|nr:PIN domain-containing protein [Oscillospiraceae bacterium]
MTEFKRIFLDTTPLIYFLDDNEQYGELTKAVFKEVYVSEKEVLTSAVTCMEYLVHPYRTGNLAKVDVFFEFIEDYGVDLIKIDTDIAEMAAKIRATYSSFKPMDSLQLAVAVVYGCDLFLTNDKQLKQFTDVKCVTVEDWFEDYNKSLK